MPKGNAQWKPHNRMDVSLKKEGYGYRFIRNDELNLRNKAQEGWVIPNATNGLGGEFLEEQDKTSGGRKHGDLILAVMDNETIKARTQYFDAQSDAQIAGIKKNLKGDLTSSNRTAVAHGDVKIERGGRAQVIQ